LLDAQGGFEVEEAGDEEHGGAGSRGAGERGERVREGSKGVRE
jgi:hypothetical protein